MSIQLLEGLSRKMNLEHEQGHEGGVTQYTVVENEDYI